MSTGSGDGTLTNRLGAESSPYLKQHADNPVAWQPWDEQAIAAARAADLPILLSIGYSACHWCHVMAHESFEDEATAGVMNAHFVNIKVDREERPDLDKVYQLAYQLLTQQTGGWPLTAFLDPETLLPFFAGTYFPKTPRHQLPGFTDLLLRISETFQSKRDELNDQGEKVSEVLQSLNAPREEDAEGVPGMTHIQAAHEMLAAQYDPSEGGFGTAPKFPMPGTLAPGAPALGPEPGARGQAGNPGPGDDQPHQDGSRRYLRSPWRRLFPLRHGSEVDGPPLREDALRQRPAARALQRSVVRGSGSVVRGRPDGNRRLVDPGYATSGGRLFLGARMPTPKGRKVSTTSGAAIR